MYASGSRLFHVSPTTVNVATKVFTAQYYTEITRIMVSNGSGTERRFSIYHGAAGETIYPPASAILRNYEVAAYGAFINSISAIGSGVTLAPGDTIAVSVSADDITFTFYGVTANLIGAN